MMPLTGHIEEPTYDRQQNNKDHCMNGLVRDSFGDGGQNVSKASEFKFGQNAHETTTKAELAQFHHQLLFSPPIKTIVSAIENDQLSSFPGLKKALLNHRPISSATSKGNIHKNRKDLRSTRAKQGEIKEAKQYLTDMNPPQLICSTTSPNVLCYAALAYTVTGTIYTDLPGRFPV